MKLKPRRSLLVAPIDTAFPMRSGWEAMPVATAIQHAAGGFA